MTPDTIDYLLGQLRDALAHFQITQPMVDFIAGVAVGMIVRGWSGKIRRAASTVRRYRRGIL